MSRRLGWEPDRFLGKGFHVDERRGPKQITIYNANCIDIIKYGVDAFDPIAKGEVKCMDNNVNEIPPETFAEFQKAIRDAIQKLEDRVHREPA